MEELPLLICMMGLPRSGKSTIARKFTYPIVNRDSIRLALHGQRYLQSAEPMVKATAKLMVKALFLAGHKVVVVDETNTTRARRDFWCSKDWSTEFYPVDTPVGVCISRARECGQDDLEPVIKQMAERFEPLQPDERRFQR